MKRWPRLIGFVLAIAVAVHLVTVWAIPRLIVARVYDRIAESGGIGAPIRTGLPDANSRNVVMPSPDLLYVVCLYDVTDHPLEIVARVPRAYWSLAVYAMNSDNVFAINDRQLDGELARFVIARKGQGAGVAPGDGSARLITVPGRKGVVLVRILAREGVNSTAAFEAQKTVDCRYLKD